MLGTAQEVNKVLSQFATLQELRFYSNWHILLMNTKDSQGF